jgi:hypothetical protein
MAPPVEVEVVEPGGDEEEELDTEFVADLNKEHEHDIDFVEGKDGKPKGAKKKPASKKPVKKAKKAPKEEGAEDEEEEMDTDFVADLNKDHDHDVAFKDGEVHQKKRQKFVT